MNPCHETHWVFICDPNENVDYMTFSKYTARENKYSRLFKQFARFVKFVLV